MQVFKYVHKLQQIITEQRQSGKTIGFVPTMGALHAGHLALIRAALQQCDYVVCSIFVNPTQFNDATDLEKYPRTVAADFQKLYAVECHAIFLPEVDEIYPEPAPILPPLEFGQLTQVLEGAHRAGHFAGVVQVVHRLLDIVRPDYLYMGQKDYQQQAIIGAMLTQLSSTIQLITAPTVREKDGLAMSSRNTRLTAQQRQLAPLLHQVLSGVKTDITQQSIEHVERAAQQQLTDAGFVVDYLSVVDGTTLQAIEVFEDAKSVVVVVAASLGDIRLIDNLIIS
ncbi:MAG: pantoate--beta-alanine ligase [Bacteroidota bacterium]